MRMENGIDFLPSGEVKAADVKEMEGLWKSGESERKRLRLIGQGREQDAICPVCFDEIIPHYEGIPCRGCGQRFHEMCGGQCAACNGFICLLRSRTHVCIAYDGEVAGEREIREISEVDDDLVRCCSCGHRFRPTSTWDRCLDCARTVSLRVALKLCLQQRSTGMSKIEQASSRSRTRRST